jgi:hypothetical protein
MTSSKRLIALKEFNKECPDVPYTTLCQYAREGVFKHTKDGRSYYVIESDIKRCLKEIGKRRGNRPTKTPPGKLPPSLIEEQRKKGLISVKEASEIIGCSPSTVYTHICDKAKFCTVEAHGHKWIRKEKLDERLGDIRNGIRGWAARQKPKETANGQQALFGGCGTTKITSDLHSAPESPFSIKADSDKARREALLDGAERHILLAIEFQAKGRTELTKGLINVLKAMTV